jgi:hypothetical protein
MNSVVETILADSRHDSPRNECTIRAERALKLYEDRGHLIHQFGTGLYRVPSCSGKGFYTVDYLEERCTCPDFEYRGEVCKHIYAVGISRAIRRSGVKVRTISAAGAAFKAAAKRCRCCGCGERFASRELVAVGSELVAFGHEVLEGERYCKPCARRRGVL